MWFLLHESKLSFYALIIIKTLTKGEELQIQTPANGRHSEMQAHSWQVFLIFPKKPEICIFVWNLSNFKCCN